MPRKGEAPGPGRPSLLTKPNRKAILDAVRDGTPHKFACQGAGVAYRTFQGWARQGRADNRAGKSTEYSAFLRDLVAAEGKGMAARMKLIQAAAKKDWRAAHAVNLSRYPEHFAPDRAELRRLRAELGEAKKLLVEVYALQKADAAAGGTK